MVVDVAIGNDAFGGGFDGGLNASFTLALASNLATSS